METSFSNRLTLLCLLQLFFIVKCTISFGQDRPVNEVYSMMIFNFIKYTQWPENESKKDFVIGIVGNADIFNSMTAAYNGKQFRGNKTIVISQFRNASDMTDCEV